MVRFAFTLPAINKGRPSSRYEWVVLPQGMKNSPAMCQLYVAWALQPLREQLPQTIIYHYMDDILLCQPEPFTDQLLTTLQNILEDKGPVIAPEKVQRQAPWKYLGWLVYDRTVAPQKVELTSQIHTLNDLQKLVGELQWARNLVGLTNKDLHPLMALLRRLILPRVSPGMQYTKISLGQ
ncbi:putative Pol polyprotein [Turdus rufiventris]|nr:putative Pol polyprotein [Turdus rufiventris]